MSLELSVQDKAVAEVFYSDLDHSFTISLFSQNLPLPVIERLIMEARRVLPVADAGGG